MFTKTKGDGQQPGFTPAQDAVRGASSKPAARVGASILCSDVEIKGSIKSQGALQIDGKVEGDISAGDVTIGSSGQIMGEVKAETLRVKGKGVGSIRARKVELVPPTTDTAGNALPRSQTLQVISSLTFGSGFSIPPLRSGWLRGRWTMLRAGRASNRHPARRLCQRSRDGCASP